MSTVAKSVGQAERLVGIGAKVAAELEQMTGRETRTVVLGHLLRGGTPTSFDRLLGLRFGAAVVRALDDGANHAVVTECCRRNPNGVVGGTQLADVHRPQRLRPVDRRGRLPALRDHDPERQCLCAASVDGTFAVSPAAQVDAVRKDARGAVVQKQRERHRRGGGIAQLFPAASRSI